MHLILQLPSTIATGMYQHGLKPSEGFESRQTVIDCVTRFCYGPNSKMGNRKVFQIALETLEDRLETEERYKKVAGEMNWKIGEDSKGDPCLIGECLEFRDGFVIIAAGECWQSYELVESK